MHTPTLQTITWGDPQHQLFDHIFELAAKSGFSALEIGYRRLGQVPVDASKALFEKHGLSLSATHIGGNLADLSQAGAEREGLKQVIDDVIALGGTNLMYSGLNERPYQKGVAEDLAEVDGQIEQINDAAKACADAGIHLCYHNHNWEFTNERWLFDRLLEKGCDEIFFGLDIGWAMLAGQDAASLLNEVGDRVRILHLKDYDVLDDSRETVFVGTGAVDLSASWEWLKDKQERGIHVTVEQDTAPDPDAACLANGVYLKEQFLRHFS